MKRSFLLLCTVLLVLGCVLPCAAYRLARMPLAQPKLPLPLRKKTAVSPPPLLTQLIPSALRIRAPGSRQHCHCGST